MNVKQGGGVDKVGKNCAELITCYSVFVVIRLKCL